MCILALVIGGNLFYCAERVDLVSDFACCRFVFVCGIVEIWWCLLLMCLLGFIACDDLATCGWCVDLLLICVVWCEEFGFVYCSFICK